MSPTPTRTDKGPQGRSRTGKSGKSRVADGELCPKCGRRNAYVIGRSESFPVVYFRCDDCGRASVAPA